MARPDSLTDRLLSLLGLHFDITVDMDADAFNAIRSTLFVGSRPRVHSVAALEDAGITHIVSCLPPGDRPKVAFLGESFRWMFIGARDGMNHDIASSFPPFFDFALNAATDDADAKLLVHCEAGVSRSATLATALLMKTERLRFFEAFMAVRAKRPGVLVNIGFASQLQRLEHAQHPHPDGEMCSLARYLHEICKVPVEIDVLHDMLDNHDHDGPRAIRAIFGDDIPRVVQGARL